MEERHRLMRMDLDYQHKLEDALENGNVKSTRSAVVPIFERIYAAWCDRYGMVNEARATAKRTEAVEMPGPVTTFVGGERIEYDPQRPFTTATRG
jgi:hypothetical protein